MDYGDIRLVTGAQGSGKTTTGVALPVDDVYSNLTAIVSPNGERLNARALTLEEQDDLELSGVIYNQFEHVMVFADDGKSSKIISLPKDWFVSSPIRIFANFAFYGVRYVPADLGRLLEYINTDLMTNGWIVMDESIMTDRRDTMTLVGKMVAWFGAQARRRNLHMVVIAQSLGMIQSRFNLFATTRVDCTYDEHTRMISLEANKNSKVMQSTTYYAPNYWRFFKHDEIVKIPQAKIDKALQTVT